MTETSCAHLYACMLHLQISRSTRESASEKILDLKHLMLSCTWKLMRRKQTLTKLTAADSYSFAQFEDPPFFASHNDVKHSSQAGSTAIARCCSRDGESIQLWPRLSRSHRKIITEKILLMISSTQTNRSCLKQHSAAADRCRAIVSSDSITSCIQFIVVLGARLPKSHRRTSCVDCW